MSVLVVGLSHRTAPISVLERAALSTRACRALEAALCTGEHVSEAVVLGTCNRLEVYAEVGRFHGGVADIGGGLAAATGVPLSDLSDHLYVHYEDAAIAHLFTVVCGLDSMAVGEQQILGQVRTALRAAQDGGSVGRRLDRLLQQALRVGKRAHTQTGLDRAGHSLVEAGLQAAAGWVGPLAAAHVAVVGAGAMSGLAVATLVRLGAGRVTVLNRTPERAERLAASCGGLARPMAELPQALVEADVVVSCTGAVGHLIDRALVAATLAARDGRRQAYVDLALPRDIDPGVDEVPGATVIDLEVLGRQLAATPVAAELGEVHALVNQEVADYLSGQRADAVAPTVVALRAHARALMEAELARLQSRLPEVDDRVRAELEQTVHRVVEKLLHTPTVRVKELARGPGGSSYAEALRELFGLDLGQVAAVSDLPAKTGIPAPAGVPGPAGIPGAGGVPGAAGASGTDRTAGILPGPAAANGPSVERITKIGQVHGGVV